MKFVAGLFAALSFLALQSCASYGAGDMVADLGCGARESACLDQCRKIHDRFATVDEILQCQDSCKPPETAVCR